MGGAAGGLSVGGGCGLSGGGSAAGGVPLLTGMTGVTTSVSGQNMSDGDIQVILAIVLFLKGKRQPGSNFAIPPLCFPFLPPPPRFLSVLFFQGWQWKEKRGPDL